ncbi:MAG: AMP-binding protein [Tetrasphaera sp.]
MNTAATGPEQWSWPPAPDNTYLPDPASPYWFPHRETMPPEQRDELILGRIQQLMAYAWEKAPFYRRKWTAAGLEPGDIKTLADFEQVPVIVKQELRESQANHEPYGDYLCVDEAEVKHIHGTSGTTGRPTMFGLSEPDWQHVANAHARVMWSMGIRPSDTVFVGSLFSLYMGSWGALIGAQRLGCRVFPFGAGVAGQTARAVNWLRQSKPTVFYGTPSYALRIAEIARSEGIDPREFGLRVMFFSGEPGAAVASVRKLLEDSYGAAVRDSGSMAEVSPWMNLAESDGSRGPLLWQDIVYTEVCDPDTLHRVPYGSEGTPVYTTLERASQPMIRLLSNDLTRWEDGPSPCGRTYPSLPKGIYGRIDDMLVIRGENIYPSAIDDVLNATPGYGGEHRVVVSTDRTMDQLVVRAEPEPGMPQAALPQWCESVAEALRRVLGVRVEVQPAPPGSIERTDLKARRVIDERDLAAESRVPS